MSSEYPDSKHDDALQVGAEFLDFVVLALQPMGLYLQPFTSRRYQYLMGESLQGWEVKYDSRCTETGRLSIEIAEKTRASNAVWVPSGIYRQDNTWLYIQGNYEQFYIFMKGLLVGLHGSGRYEEHELSTIRKFYLPLDAAKRYGRLIIPATSRTIMPTLPVPGAEAPI